MKDLPLFDLWKFACDYAPYALPELLIADEDWRDVTTGMAWAVDEFIQQHADHTVVLNTVAMDSNSTTVISITPDGETLYTVWVVLPTADRDKYLR